MMSPWPPPGRGQVNLPPPPPANSDAPPRSPSRRRWLLVIGGLAIVVAAMVVSAGITYRLTSHQNTPPPTENKPSAPAPQTYSEADRATAKQRVCDVFDASVRGQGAVVVGGGPNLPTVLQKLGSVVAVENALSPATPSEVAAAAHKYIDTALDLTTGAMRGAPVDEVRRLTVAGNDAAYAFADVCEVER